MTETKPLGDDIHDLVDTPAANENLLIVPNN
jgi:hypothetical protein